MADSIYWLLLEGRRIVSPACDARVPWWVADIRKGSICDQGQVMKIPIWTWLGFAGAVVSTSDSPDLNSLVEIRKREQKKKKKT